MDQSIARAIVVIWSANPALSVLKKRGKVATLSRRKIKRVHTPVRINYGVHEAISDKEFGSDSPTVDMCACRHRKSFLIEDILNDQKRPHRSPTTLKEIGSRTRIQEVKGIEERDMKVQWEIDSSRVNLGSLDQRITYPLHPTPIKAGIPWHYRPKQSSPVEFTYYSEPVMDMNHILRSQLAATRLVPHPYGVRETYGFDRGKSMTTKVLQFNIRWF